MPRYFLEPGRWGKGASLTGDEAHHCARVMRAVAGDEIEVFDGQGRGAAATVLSVSKQEVELELGEGVVDPPPPVRLVLAMAVLKGRAMEWLIQKAVEIGADAIVPVVTERCIARRDGSGWRRTILEACKQCGRRRLPELREAVSLREYLAAGGGGLRLIASLAAGAKPLREWLGRAGETGEIVFLVGPEGDFTGEETAAALEAGFHPVTLGPAVLRAETAALAGLAAVACAIH
jgi:16S rRNA (uracil1498-N3)-methyltransferase